MILPPAVPVYIFILSRRESFNFSGHGSADLEGGGEPLRDLSMNKAGLYWLACEFVDLFFRVLWVYVAGQACRKFLFY